MSDENRGYVRAVQSEVFRAGVSGRRPAVPIDPAALELAARKAIPAEAFAYLAGGAGSEATMAANRSAFDRWQIWPRVLRDVGSRDLSIELFGRRRATPFLLSPIGVAELAHAEADVAVGRAAAELDVPYVLSNQASRPWKRSPRRWARDRGGSSCTGARPTSSTRRSCGARRRRAARPWW